MATKRQQLAIDYLVTKHNLSLHTAQGIVGGLSGESGTNLDSKARNKGDGKDGSDSVGMAQWNGMRAVNGAKFLGKPILEANGYEQLDFLMHELKGVESKAFGHISSADNAADVTRAFVKYFERPADKNAGDIRAKNYTSVLTGVKPTEGFVAPDRATVTPEQQKATDEYIKAEQDRINAKITKETNEAVLESKGENDVPWYDIYGQGTKFGRQIATRGLGTVAEETALGFVDGVQNVASNAVKFGGDVGSKIFNGGEPSTKPFEMYLQKQADDTLANNKLNAERNATSMGYTGGEFVGETAPLLAVPMAAPAPAASLATRGAYLLGNAALQGTAAYVMSDEESRGTNASIAAGITASLPVVGRALGAAAKYLPDAYPSAARAERQVGRDLYANMGNAKAGTNLDTIDRTVADTNLSRFRTDAVDNTSLINDVNPTTQEVLGNKFYNDSVKLNANANLINANEANYAARQAFVDKPTDNLKVLPSSVTNPFSGYRPIDTTKSSDAIANELRDSVQNNVGDAIKTLRTEADDYYKEGARNNFEIPNPKDTIAKLYQDSITTSNGSTRSAMVQPELGKILQAYGDNPTVNTLTNHQLRSDLKAYSKSLETSTEPNIASKQKVINDILDTTKFTRTGSPDANYSGASFTEGDKLYAQAKELEDLKLYKTATKDVSAEQSLGNIASTAKGRAEMNQYLDSAKQRVGNADIYGIVNPMRNSMWSGLTKTKGDAPLVFDDKLQQKIVESNTDDLATKLGMTKELEALSKEIKFTKNSKGTMVLGSNTTEKLMNIIGGKSLNIASVGAIATAVHTGGASIAVPVAVALYKSTARKAFLKAFNDAAVDPKVAVEAIDKFLSREATQKAIDKTVTKAIKAITKTSNASVLSSDQ